jgi:outer membrane protein assembly factor BamB
MRFLILTSLILLSCGKHKNQEPKELNKYTRSGFLSSTKSDGFIKKLGPYYLHKKKKNIDSIKAILIKSISLNIDREQTISSFPDTEISFSPNEKFLAIGSYFGELILYSIEDDKILWRKKFPLSVIKKLRFSDDSKQLFVGEQSSDANIYSLEAETAKILWTYRTANDIQSSAYNPNDPYSIYSLPGIFHLDFKNGTLQVAALHSWFEDGIPKKLSRIYSFDRSGKRLWQYPERENFPANIKYFDQNNEYIVFTIDEITNKTFANIKENSLVLLDAENGHYLDSKVIDILEPHFNSVYFWQSVSINKLNFINFAAFDGRGFIYKIDERKLYHQKTLNLGTPIEISGIPVSSGIPYTAFTNKHAYFSLAQSSIPYLYSEKYKVNEPPSFHPEAGSLIATDQKGETVWKFQSGLIYSAFHFNKKENLFIALIDNKPENRAKKTFGFTLFKVGDFTKELYTFKTKFPVFFRGAISSSGDLAAITEANLNANDELVYRVHLVH